MPGPAPITAERLAAMIPAGTMRLLIRTRGGQTEAGEGFDPGYAALTADAAGWLSADGIRLVGLDTPSVDFFAASDFPVHRRLLAENVIIIENLVLNGVSSGAYELLCLPLRLAGCDGAPREWCWRRRRDAIA